MSLGGLDLGAATLGLAFLAGLVTTLSPCVLPILPMVAASAGGRSRWGLPALAVGLALSFTVIGLALASGGHLLGLEERALRVLAGGLMLVIGLVLLSERLQALAARLTAGLGQAGGDAVGRIHSDHPAAQFGVGALLGVAWTPCVGPTLGAAIALAATGQGLAESAVVMAVFGFAAALPLALLGLASRAVVMRQRERLARFGALSRRLMGGGLLLVGVLVLSGLDKWLEVALLDLSPAWLVDLTTRF
jgi:cytochrome c biogenesis protein CcdA